MAIERLPIEDIERASADLAASILAYSRALVEYTEALEIWLSRLEADERRAQVEEDDNVD